MPAGLYHYPRAGFGPLRLIPWLGLLAALGLAYILFAKPIPLVPSTLPGGYFGLLLASATSIYFFRYDWYHRQQFELMDSGLATITPRGRRDVTAWGDLVKAQFHTNTGALVLARDAGRRSLILYPASLEKGAELVAAIDRRTSLNLSSIPDLQAALQRAV